MIPSGASDRIHVLAFDYRCFGNSMGSPTEEGLIDVVSYPFISRCVKCLKSWHCFGVCSSELIRL